MGLHQCSSVRKESVGSGVVDIRHVGARRDSGICG
jgi:hypothetical protein